MVTRQRRFAGVAAVVISVVAVGCTSSEPAAITDPTFGLTLGVPDGWEVQPIGGDVEGFTLSSGELPPGPASGWVLEPDVAPGEVFVQIGGSSDGVRASSQPSLLPLDLERDAQDPAMGRAGEYLPFRHRSQIWELIAMYGEGVSDDVVRDLEDLVASIRFLPLADPPAGTTTSSFGVRSLGASDRFPTGSVTAIESEEGEELLVVAGPRGPYAAPVVLDEDCRLSWDDDRQEFSCGVRRWDIRGEPLNEAAVGVITSFYGGGVDPDGRMWLATTQDPRMNVAEYWDEPVA